MEEDPKMYEAAGIPSQVALQTTNNSVLIQQSIEQLSDLMKDNITYLSFYNISIIIHCFHKIKEKRL